MRDTKLWYNTPANEWTEALPLGNGHMGAMAFGGESGKYDLSENTCWSGKKEENPLKDVAHESMRSARESLLRGDYTDAEIHLENCFGKKVNYGTQLPMARLFVSVEKETNSQTRELDLFSGIATDKMYFDNSEVIRTSFISNPSKVMCVRVASNGQILPPIRVWIEGYSQPSKTQIEDNNLIVNGRALENIHSDGLNGVEYCCHLRYNTDGKIAWSRKGIVITEATDLICYITTATNMFYPNFVEICNSGIIGAESKGFDALLEEHIKEHSSWMNKCSFEMTDGFTELPTDKRLEKFRKDKADKSLITLMFQYGRYVLLNSSRPDSLLPAALQGIWNDNRACRMEWTDDMHLDINTQMNYFPAESTGLSECCEPLFNWIEDILKPQGEKVAKELYNADGWVAHTVSNAYGWAAPGWGIDWGIFLSGGAWISSHIWQHYLYTGDKKFLEKHWDVLKGSAKFMLSVLSEELDSGKLITIPSYSPENCFKHNGKAYYVTVGATVDIAVTKYIFDSVLQSAKLLGKTDSFLQKIMLANQRLPEFSVGNHGQLQEWFYDYEEAIPDHRHTSHLLAVYPFNQINIEDTPDLVKAAKISLERRLGDNAKDIVYANWAGALLILYYARFREGEKAGDFVEPMISYLARNNMMITHEGDTSSITGGIYELDGNTGFTSGIVEMLLQCYKINEVYILPAIPQDWKNGSFKGLTVYGGHKIDAVWQNGNLIEVIVCAGCNAEINLKYKNYTITDYFDKNQAKRFVYSEGTNKFIEAK